MPTPKKGARLGGSPAHQRLILSNLATALFEHGRITTTEAKARTLRPYAERLITKAKKGDLHNRRLVMRVIRDKGVVHALFTEIAPQFAERPGGYTRITKIGPRKGDNAPMAVIELVNEPYAPKETHGQAGCRRHPLPRHPGRGDPRRGDHRGRGRRAGRRGRDLRGRHRAGDEPVTEESAEVADEAADDARPDRTCTTGEARHPSPVAGLRRLHRAAPAGARRRAAAGPRASTVGPSRRITATVPGPIAPPSCQPTSAPRPWTAL